MSELISGYEQVYDDNTINIIDNFFIDVKLHYFYILLFKDL